MIRRIGKPKSRRSKLELLKNNAKSIYNLSENVEPISATANRRSGSGINYINTSTKSACGGVLVFKLYRRPDWPILLDASGTLYQVGHASPCIVMELQN